MRNILWILCACLLSGCFGASDNPREGGLFGYNPKVYQARQHQKQEQLNALQQEDARHKADKAALEIKRTQAQARNATMQRDIAALKKELATNEKKLNSLKAENAPQAQKLAEMRQQQAQLAASAQKLGPANTAAKQQELTHLQEKLRRLEQEAEALSRL